MGKGEIARNEQFLLFPQCFLSVRVTLCHFCQTLNCRLQTLSVWKSLKFLVWERVNSTLTAKVISWRSVMRMFPGFLTPVLTQLFFPKPPTTFLTCFCRGERRKFAERKTASTGDQTCNHQVMSLTCSPLSHPGGAPLSEKKNFEICLVPMLQLVTPRAGPVLTLGASYE